MQSRTVDDIVVYVLCQTKEVSRFVATVSMQERERERIYQSKRGLMFLVRVTGWHLSPLLLRTVMRVHLQMVPSP